MHPAEGRNPCVHFLLALRIDSSRTVTSYPECCWFDVIELTFHNHIRCRFGEIPGFRVGSRWKGRRELCDAGVHAHLTGGIHGRGKEGAFSIVLCVRFKWLTRSCSLTVHGILFEY